MGKNQNKEILEDIEMIREKLYSKIGKDSNINQENIYNSDLLEISNELDHIIVKYMKDGSD